MSQLQRVLGWPEGAALTIAAVLGSGVLYLPALSANLAGPGALIAWIGMGLLCIPFATTMMQLSLRHPDAGGIATFAADAFGPAGRTVAGWLYLGTMPIAAPVAALIGVRYIWAVLPLTPLETALGALALFSLAIVLNWLGVALSGRAAGMIVAIIAALLVVSVAANAWRVHLAAFEPFLPHGLAPVGLAAALLYWAFVGWEAIAHYAEEFRDPERDLRRSLAVSIVVIVVLYLAVVVVTIGARAYGNAQTGDSLAVLMGAAFGPAGRVVMAVLALLICYGTIHTYVGSFARLIYAQARSGQFPAYFGQVNPKTGTPTRALAWLLVMYVVVLAADVVAGLPLEGLLAWASGMFIALYVISMAAGLRLLVGVARRLQAAIGLVVSVLMLAFLGVAALLPFAVAAVALLWHGRRAAAQRTASVREIS